MWKTFIYLRKQSKLRALEKHLQKLTGIRAKAKLNALATQKKYEKLADELSAMSTL